MLISCCAMSARDSPSARATEEHPRSSVGDELKVKISGGFLLLLDSLAPGRAWQVEIESYLRNRWLYPQPIGNQLKTGERFWKRRYVFRAENCPAPRYKGRHVRMPSRRQLHGSQFHPSLSVLQFVSYVWAHRPLSRIGQLL